MLLSQIVTGPSSILTIDSTFRKEIKFIEIIKAFVRLHKHRGGPLNPSKINLESEVKGQLAPFRIADFDAEKITTGIFDIARIPLLDHQLLQNVGLLTHPQLDTFVKTIENNNTELFGEIATANLLQFIIAHKLIYEDPLSPIYQSGVIVDQNMVNELVIIPGITPNDLIDTDNTTAIINYEQHYVEGIAPSTGTSFFVRYDTNLAWNSVYNRENLIVVGDDVSLSFAEIESSTDLTLENFESATESNQIISTGGLNLFSRQLPTLVDDANILANSNATDTSQGFYSGKFKHRISFRSQFVKEFTVAQDWTTYDSFVLDIKCSSLSHGPVRLFFTAVDGQSSVNYSLLAQDAITDGFEIRAIDLTEIPFRNQIKSFTIYSDDTISEFSYNIDNIHLERAILLPEEGIMKIRYSTSAIVTFSMIDWNSTELSGSLIKIRARTANNTVLLTRSEFTDYLSNGDAIDLEGTDLEIEIYFTPDADRIISPILHSLRILIITDAETDGYAIDTDEEFERGEVINVSVDSNSVSLETPIYVDSLYFALGNSVNQVNRTGSTFSSDGIALFGANSPISPNQVFQAVEEQGLTARTQQAKLSGPRSVRRDKRRFLIADTYHDRVLEYNEEGNLLSGIGSINYAHGSAIFPISACFDSRTNILYVVWSKKVSFKTINVSKITVQSPNERVELVRDFDKILGFTTEELNSNNAEGQIMPIHMSIQNAGLIETLSGDQTFLQVDGSSNGVIPGGISIDSVFYKAIVTGLGIPLFIGNFMYRDGIFTPTYAEKTESGNTLVANGTLAVKDYVFPAGVAETVTKTVSVSSIVEFDLNNNIVFGSNAIQFSPFVPGKAQEIDDDLLLIGGLKPGLSLGTPDANHPFNFRAITGDHETKLIQKETLNQIFFGSDQPSMGYVVTVDKSTGAITFQYDSPEGVVVSSIDTDSLGQYVVALSSFTGAGKIVKLDAIGNVIYATADNGDFGIINSIEVQYDDSIVIST